MSIRGVLGTVALVLMLAAIWLTSPALPKPQTSADAPPAHPREIMDGRVTAVRVLPPSPGGTAGAGLNVPDAQAGAGTGGAAGGSAGSGGSAGREVTVHLTSGSQAGHDVTIDIQDSSVASVPVAARQYQPGNMVVVAYEPDAAQGLEGDAQPFTIVDQRRWPWLLWGGVVFAGAVAAVAGKQGVRALVALASAVCVLWWYLIPRLLDGAPPVQVALVACALIAVPSLLLTHGMGRDGMVPLLGVGGALVLVGVFALVAVQVAALSGLGVSEEVALLYAGTGGAIDARGLLLAGLLIGVVGGLVDVTVAQAAAVFEFHAADPMTPRRALFQRGMVVGRAHVAAAVHTLVLAYAGAALPVLLLFAMYSSLLDTVWNREMIAAELLRTVAGGLGLAAAMPLTTWLACLTCRPARRRLHPMAYAGRGPGAPGEAGHSHAGMLSFTHAEDAEEGEHDRTGEDADAVTAAEEGERAAAVTGRRAVSRLVPSPDALRGTRAPTGAGRSGAGARSPR